MIERYANMIEPDAGGVVMGTGIVSIVLLWHGSVATTRVLFGIAAVAWVIFAAVFARRLLSERERCRAEAATPAALTAVAGTTVIGARAALFGWTWAAWPLLGPCGQWCARSYPDPMARSSGPALGEIIRQQRELAKLSMRQFAALAGISNPYLSQIERGLRAPSEQVLDGIASVLKISADALYEQAGITPPDAEDNENALLDAIANDERLTARQRTALREVYESFVSSAPAPRSRPTR